MDELASFTKSPLYIFDEPKHYQSSFHNEPSDMKSEACMAALDQSAIELDSRKPDMSCVVEDRDQALQDLFGQVEQTYQKLQKVQQLQQTRKTPTQNN